MKKTIIIILSALISLYLIFFLDIFSISSDEQEVRRTFRELVDDFQITTETPPLDRLFKAKKISKYFAENFRGTLTGVSKEVAKKELTPKKVEETLLGYYRVTHTASPEIISESYESKPPKVVLTGIVRIIAEEEGEQPRYLEELAVKLSFEKLSGEWLITDGEVERRER